MFCSAILALRRLCFYRMDAWDTERQTNKLTEEDFKTWTEMASKMRLAYKQGEISGEDLIKKISEKTNEHD